jgi:hypothetical protein
MMEEWRWVSGYEGIYEVSTEGRVRSHHKSPRILKPNTTSNYASVTLYRPGRIQTWRVHRLVLETFVGPPPEGTEGCHNNGDKWDNRVENLRWDTHTANQREMYRDHGVIHAQSRKTHCANGHEFTESNTMVVNDGTARRCRTCKREYARNYMQNWRKTA